MRGYLKLASLWPDIAPPRLARGFQWASAWVSGSTNSSSRHCLPRASWSRMSSISIMGEEPRIAVLADEDIEEDPDRWCSYTECGQEFWQIACQWVWNLRLCLGQRMQGVQ